MDKNETAYTGGLESVSFCPHGTFYNGEVCPKCAESFKEMEARKHFDEKMDKIIELLEKLPTPKPTQK